MKQRFWICAHCKKVIAIVRASGAATICCGEEMKEIVPGTVEASREKHIPVYTVKDGVVRVTVGSVSHPMEQAHFIEWVSLQTRFGNQRKELKPGAAPEACFALCENDEVEAVYAFCNLHGLWTAQ